MWLIVLCGFLICVLISLYLIWSRQITYLMDGLQAIKGPKTYPLIGGILEAFPPSQALWKCRKLINKYGKTFKIATAYGVGIITADPNFIEHITTSPACIQKSMLYMFMTNWLGGGLLTSTPRKWRQRRKLITPTFHFSILEQFLEVFDRNARVLGEKLAATIDIQKGDIDICEYVILAALDNINETAMGTMVNAQSGGHMEYIEAAKFLSTLVYDRIVSPIKAFNWTFRLTPDYYKEKKYLRIVHDYTLSVIRARRLQLAESNHQELNAAEDSFGIRKKTVFLDLLLQASVDGQPLSDDDIREEVDNIMYAGHDTVATAMTFTLDCISKHPDIQAKLVQEQIEIFGDDSNRVTTMDEISQMSYLEMVIKESLRLFPSAPAVGRTSTEDFRYGDINVRAGTELLMMIYVLHKDPTIYPEPEKFIPERFTPENCARRHPFAYIPFSAGHRNCIGQKYAVMEMKVTIGLLLRRFVLAPTVPEHKCVFPSAIVMYSSNGVYVNLRERKLIK